MLTLRMLLPLCPLPAFIFRSAGLRRVPLTDLCAPRAPVVLRSSVSHCHEVIRRLGGSSLLLGGIRETRGWVWEGGGLEYVNVQAKEALRNRHPPWMCTWPGGLPLWQDCPGDGREIAFASAGRWSRLREPVPDGRMQFRESSGDKPPARPERARLPFCLPRRPSGRAALDGLCAVKPAAIAPSTTGRHCVRYCVTTGEFYSVTTWMTAVW